MTIGGVSVWLRRATMALAAVVGVCTVASDSTDCIPTSGLGSARALGAQHVAVVARKHSCAGEDRARDHGFNTLLVQVRGRGDAYYTSELEPRAAELVRQPASFDPLATVIDDAHQAGLRVHAWMNLNLVSSAAELPSARDHIIYRHPEWLMVPREIAQDLRTLDPAQPRVRRQAGAVGACAAGQARGALCRRRSSRSAANHIEAVVADVARRYAVDGVHLDYVRYPERSVRLQPGRDRGVPRGDEPEDPRDVRRELGRAGAGGSVRVS